MKSVKVKSSFIDKVEFWNDEKNLQHDIGTVRIKFLDGNIYNYSSVPFKIFCELCKAKSVGNYYCTNIKGKYSCLKHSYNFFNNYSFTQETEDDKTIPKSDKVTIYEVYEPLDKTLGGKKKTIGYFKCKEVAEYVLKNESVGIMGSYSGTGINEIELCTSSTVFEYKNSRKDIIRKNALAKLTFEEKRVLGLL